jgi:hypothetical protein
MDNGERRFREQSMAAIKADDELFHHVVLIEAVMDHLDFHTVLSPEHDDHQTVQLLGARIFNDLASAFGQLTRGYYQVAAMILRDVMEITFLLGMFERDSAQITKWRDADDKTLKKNFSPFAVRVFLEGHDEWEGGNRRAEMYGMFCTYAAHASWKGFALMGPTGGGKRTIGAFFDQPLMKAIIVEMAQLSAMAGNNFAALCAGDGSIASLAIKRHRLEVTSGWAERFLGRKPSANDFD